MSRLTDEMLIDRFSSPRRSLLAPIMVLAGGVLAMLGVGLAALFGILWPLSALVAATIAIAIRVRRRAIPGRSAARPLADRVPCGSRSRRGWAVWVGGLLVLLGMFGVSMQGLRTSIRVGQRTRERVAFRQEFMKLAREGGSSVLDALRVAIADPSDEHGRRLLDRLERHRGVAAELHERVTECVRGERNPAEADAIRLYRLGLEKWRDGCARICSMGGVDPESLALLETGDHLRGLALAGLRSEHECGPVQTT